MRQQRIRPATWPQTDQQFPSVSTILIPTSMVDSMNRVVALAKSECRVLAPKGPQQKNWERQSPAMVPARVLLRPGVCYPVRAANPVAI
jgi:hypothetical protein